MTTTISQHDCLEQIAAISPSTLIDINWSVRLVAASSTAATLNELRVLLQLRLLDKTASSGDNQSQSQSQIVTVELNQNELNEFITKLKETRSTMFALSK